LGKWKITRFCSSPGQCRWT